jgi:hypothetical protein
MLLAAAGFIAQTMPILPHKHKSGKLQEHRTNSKPPFFCFNPHGNVVEQKLIGKRYVKRV